MTSARARKYLGWAVWAGSALMVFGIVFGALRASRHEPTTFQDARDRIWPVTPVVVGASADVEKAYGQQVRDAVMRINGEVGCTVLSTHGAPVAIRIITAIDDSPCANAGQPVNPDDDGAVTHVCSRGTTDIVLVRGGWHIHQAFLIIKHELLHALGIDHDPSGLMATRHPDWNWQAATFDLPGEMMSEADRRVLAARYCMEPADAR